VDLVVECLPNKHEALSSNPNTAKKKKKKRFGREKMSKDIYNTITGYVFESLEIFQSVNAQLVFPLLQY
jgi:hypothetical protein